MIFQVYAALLDAAGVLSGSRPADRPLVAGNPTLRLLVTVTVVTVPGPGRPGPGPGTFKVPGPPSSYHPHTTYVQV